MVDKNDMEGISTRRVLEGAKAGYGSFRFALILMRESGHDVGVIPPLWNDTDSTMHAMWRNIADAVLQETLKPRR